MQTHCIDGGTVFELYGDQPRDEYWCRKMCHEAGFAFTGYLNYQCACTDHTLEATACSNSTWIVMLTSALHQLPLSTKLQVDLYSDLPLFDSVYYDVGESLQLKVTSNFDSVVLDIDFGDGMRVEEMVSENIDHVYTQEGDFTVEVSAWRGDQHVTSSMTVSVRDIDLGSPPNLEVDLLSDKAFTELALTMDAVVYGDFPTNCTLSPGDYQFEVKSEFHRLNADFIFSEPGTDIASLSCVNRFGSSTTLEIPVRSSSVDVVSMEWQESDRFQISIDLRITDSIKLHVDNVNVRYEYDMQAMVISFDSSKLRSPGMHSISVLKESVRIYSASVLYEEPITDLKLQLDSPYLAVGALGQLNVSLSSGDPAHVYIDFKNGSDAYLFHNEKSGLTETFDIMFSQAGKYNIEVRAVNSRGEVKSSDALLVEHRLTPVTTMVENILSLEEAALFHLISTNEYDVAVECEFQYSDERFQMDVTLLGQEQMTPVYYFFVKYGVHNVKITVSNHVSFVETTVTVKVRWSVLHNCIVVWGNSSLDQV